MHNWVTLLTAAAFILLVTACSLSEPAVPSTVSPEVARALERLENVQKIGPHLQQQLKRMEELHADPSTNCSASYPEKCIALPPPDLECEDMTQRNFWVLPPDPHNFDPDGNGIGCEG